MKVLAVQHGPLMYTKILLCLERLGLELVAEAVRRAGHSSCRAAFEALLSLSKSVLCPTHRQVDRARAKTTNGMTARPVIPRIPSQVPA
jgi:hypothetical protein